MARLDEAAAALNMTRRALSLRAGLDATFIQKMEDRGPRAAARPSSLMRLADAAGIPRDDLLNLLPEAVAAVGGAGAAGSLERAEARKIPIRGVAAGSVVGAFVISDQTIGWVDCPPGLQTVADAYAVYVTNDSMTPMHSPGDLRFVHPHKPPRPGDSIIVQISDNGLDFQAFIKILARQTPDWLICRQLHPDAEVKYARGSVRKIHKVLSTAELFNA